LAQTSWDQFEGFRSLLDYHLEAGRPIFGWFQPELWDAMDENGHLSGLRTIPLHEAESLRFARIVEHASSVAEAGEQAELARPALPRR